MEKKDFKELLCTRHNTLVAQSTTKKSKAKTAKIAALNSLFQKGRELLNIKSDSILEGRRVLLEELMNSINQEPEHIEESSHETLKRLVLDAHKKSVLEKNEATQNSWGASVGLTILNTLSIAGLVSLTIGDYDYIAGLLTAGLIKIDAQCLKEMKKVVAEYFVATGKKMELRELLDILEIPTDDIFKANEDVFGNANDGDSCELKKTL